MILMGVRSPLAVDYEIAAERCGTPFRLGVSISGFPRVMGDMQIIDLADLDGTAPAPALPCAFAPRRRAELARLAAQAGLPLACALVDPTAILPPQIRIGAGSFVNAGVVAGGGTVLGDGVVVNRSASIGHHCVLEDFVSIGPGAILSGNVRVGQGSMIGAGAIVQSDVRIGRDVLVSAGSVVRKPVPDGALVAGNPAREMPFRARRSSLDTDGGE